MFDVKTITLEEWIRQNKDQITFKFTGEYHEEGEEGTMAMNAKSNWLQKKNFDIFLYF